MSLSVSAQPSELLELSGFSDPCAATLINSEIDGNTILFGVVCYVAVYETGLPGVEAIVDEHTETPGGFTRYTIYLNPVADTGATVTGFQYCYLTFSTTIPDDPADTYTIQVQNNLWDPHGGGKRGARSISVPTSQSTHHDLPAS